MSKKKVWKNEKLMPDQNQVDFDTKKIRHTEYSEHRSQIVVLRNQLHQTYDKALLTISTGAIVVSFTYILQIEGINYHEYLWLLVSSWFLLILSIILGLYGHHISCKSNDDCLEIADLNYDNKVGMLTAEKWDRLCFLKYKKSTYDGRISWVNKAQLYIIPIGIVLLAFFVICSLRISQPTKDTIIINCHKEELMSKEEKASPKTDIKKINKALLDEQAMSTHNEARSLLTDTSPITKTQPDISATTPSSNKSEAKTASEKPIKKTE